MKQDHALMRPLARLLGRATIYLGWPVWLRPPAAHERRPDAPPRSGRDECRALELHWRGDRTLTAGHYRLYGESPAPSGPSGAGRLFAGRAGRSSSLAGTRLHVAPARRRGRVVCAFPLHREADTLRLEWVREAGLAPGRATIRKLSRLEYYSRLVIGLAADIFRSGGSIRPGIAVALARLRRGGIRALAAELRARDGGGPWGSITYAEWIERFDRLTDAELDGLRARLAELAWPPLISVLMPVFDTPADLLREAIGSVLSQVYEDWELCVADDASTQPHVRAILQEFAARDRRIKLAFRDRNGHIAQASNSALELVAGEWVALLDHDDVLSPNALAEVALEIGNHPEAELIYSDEDKIDASGRRYDPFFKPDFSRELFRSQNYLNHLTVHRAANIRAVGGWRSGFEGSQDYDLNLRIFERIDPAAIRHIPKVLYHWRAVPGSLALEASQKNYAHRSARRALEEHVRRTGLGAHVESAGDTHYHRLRFAVPDPAPLVSLIVPTRDRVELLRGCIESIRARTTYANYEIIVVDNGSTEPATHAYLDALQQEGAVRVLSYDKPFNYSAINNFAVAAASGSIVGLVNSDIEVISPDWLTEMVSWAVQPDIGCVGAKLYFADDTIQHAGVITGIGGVAGHSHKYFPRAAAGYFSRLLLVHNVSAVTAACMVVRKEVYEKVGGLDEEHLPVAFNDVDFCLKVRAAGHANVWTPHAELYHLESKSRGSDDSPQKAERFRRETACMMSRWDLANDPCYSPNLTLEREDFSLRPWPSVLPEVAIGAIFKNEKPYVLEWIAFHRVVGIRRFFIADNDSDDGTTELLAALQSSGLVDHIAFPSVPGRPPQLPAYAEIMRRHGTDADWIAFIDADEFLLPMGGFRSIPAVLRDLRMDVGAVAVNWAIYGSSFQPRECPGLVIERFTRRAKDAATTHCHYKSIVRACAYLAPGRNPHYFELTEGMRLVHADGSEVRDHPTLPKGLSSAVHWPPLRLQHFVVKSLEEFEKRKVPRGMANVLGQKRDRSFFADADRNEVVDPVPDWLISATRREMDRLRQRLLQAGYDLSGLDLDSAEA